MSGLLEKILIKGGLRLKLIGFIVLTILMTVGGINYFTINLMKDVLSEKTFEIVETFLERISDTASIALLERTYENKVNLDEVLKEARETRSVGILDIAVYSTVKSGGKLNMSYVTGFDAFDNRTVPSLDETLSNRIISASDDTIFHEPFQYGSNGKPVSAYRFVKPIHYEYKNRSHVLGAVTIAYSKQVMFRAINQVFIVSLVISGFVMLICVVLTYLFGSHYIQPIITLAHAAANVRRGNLDTNVSFKTKDEIQVLGEEFNRMLRGLKERRLMQRYISDSTINMIRNGGYEEFRSDYEHKTMTIFFSDIRGFTSLSEENASHDVVKIVNFYFDLQADIIHEWDGEIDKFVGDSLMAVFSGEASVDRAIKASIEIQNVINERNIDRKAKGDKSVEVGIGISHGKIFAGNVGSSEQMDFTCIGSAVNLAARLCSKARPSEILINRRAYRLSKRKYDIDVLGPLDHKGFPDAIEVLSINS